MTADSATVFGEFHRRLRAFVSRRVRNPADAEDIVQETFLRIHRNLTRVRRTDRLTAWVFQVARNTIVDHYRRERRPSDESQAQVEAPAVVRTELDDEAAEFKELAACLAPLVESLPTTDREAIKLSELAGFTQREAATRAGMTLSGMKSRVQRARRKLRGMLVDCCRIELDSRGGIIDHEPCVKPCEPRPFPRPSLPRSTDKRARSDRPA